MSTLHLSVKCLHQCWTGQGEEQLGCRKARAFVPAGHTEPAENPKETQPCEVITCKVGDSKGQVYWFHRRRGRWHWGT